MPEIEKELNSAISSSIPRPACQHARHSQSLPIATSVIVFVVVLLILSEAFIGVYFILRWRQSHRQSHFQSCDSKGDILYIEKNWSSMELPLTEMRGRSNLTIRTLPAELPVDALGIQDENSYPREEPRLVSPWTSKQQPAYEMYGSIPGSESLMQNTPQDSNIDHSSATWGSVAPEQSPLSPAHNYRSFVPEQVSSNPRLTANSALSFPQAGNISRNPSMLTFHSSPGLPQGVNSLYSPYHPSSPWDHTYMQTSMGSPQHPTIHPYPINYSNQIYPPVPFSPSGIPGYSPPHTQITAKNSPGSSASPDAMTSTPQMGPHSANSM